VTPPPEPSRRLGRGLDALLGKREALLQGTAPSAATTDAPQTGSATPGTPAHTGTPVGTPVAAPTESATTSAAGTLLTLSLGQIKPNPFQPRQEFRPEELADLEASLRVNGLLQPVTVRPAPNGIGYELIAGERRFRAATRLGWTEIPALVRRVDDRTLLTLAMIENLQRSDLDPIEEADGYQRLVDDFALTTQEVAEVVGKDRSTVANALRLRALPASVKRMLQGKQLATGHARALLALANERAIVDMAREAAANHWSVREVERRVNAAKPGGKNSQPPAPKGTATPAGASAAVVARLQDKLRTALQTQVSIALTGKASGEIRITFHSNDDLERVLERLGVSVD
jgi:ParB family chromosome partitioning protein